jgi:hypothetical protein
MADVSGVDSNPPQPSADPDPKVLEPNKIMKIAVESLSTAAVAGLWQYLSAPQGMVNVPVIGNVRNWQAYAVTAGLSEAVASSVNEYAFNWEANLPSAVAEFSKPISVAVSGIVVNRALSGSWGSPTQMAMIGLNMAGASATGGWVAERVMNMIEK